MKLDLTDRQADAVQRVLSERLAGCPEDLKALGLTTREARAMWTALERALHKIQGRTKENKID